MEHVGGVQTTGVRKYEYFILALGTILTFTLIPRVLDIYFLVDELFVAFFDTHPGTLFPIGILAVELSKFTTLIPLGMALWVTNRAKDAWPPLLLVIAAYIVGGVYGYYEYLYNQDVLWWRILFHAAVTGHGVVLGYTIRNMTTDLKKTPVPLGRMLGSGLEQAIGNYLFIFIVTYLL